MSALNSSADAGVLCVVMPPVKFRRGGPSKQPPRKRTPAIISKAQHEAPAERQSAAQLQPCPTLDDSLLDIWSGIEDVWQRLSEFLVVDVIGSGEGEGVELWAGDFKTLAVGKHQDLRRAATDADLYQGRLAGRLRAVVTLIEYCGDDLVLTFSPLQLIRRWEDGNDVAAQIQAFMLRIGRIAKTK